MLRLRAYIMGNAATLYRPSLFLDFLSGVLDPRITFTRSSTATFVGSNGIIQTASTDTPRFDYDPVTLAPKGLLIEEQRTNLLAYSEQFDNAYWTKTNSTVSADATTSPDGTVDADKIVENTATGVHDVRRNVAASASTAYTQSIFIKAGERTRGQLQMFGNSGGSTVTFDLTAGTSTTAGSYGGWSSASTTITNFGNGWYRITNTATTNAGLTSLTAAYLLVNASGNASYTGDGTSGMFYWGAQLEAGALATSYIPTVASQVTRTADVATMTGTNFSNWYNQSEGTFAVEASVLSNTGNRVWMDVGPAGAFGTTAYVVQTSSSVALSPATAPVNMLSQVNTTSLLNKAAIGIANNNSVAAVNGTLGAVDTSCTMPASATQLTIGGAVWGPGGLLNGHIRSLVYYSVRLPDYQLSVVSS